jgi:iron complex outermembrane recepter protein
LPNTFGEAAVFADLTFHATNRFDIQMGGRESRVDVTYLESLQEGPWNVVVLGAPNPLVTPTKAVDASPFTYLLTPRFKLSDDLMVYGRLASGFRPGVPVVAAGVASVGSNPDKTYTYEAGLKGEFLDHRLAVDTSLYYIDWKDMQLQLFTPRFQGYWANASGAKSEGIELSLASRPVTGLTAPGWAAYNNAVLTEPLPAATNAYGVPGDRLPMTSRASGHLSLEQTFPLSSGVTGFAAGIVSFVGDRVGIFAPTPLREIYPGYRTTDLHGGVKFRLWTANVFVNNVADARGLLNGGIGYVPAIAFV